jgi:predicted amidohydrolase YtcJ
VADSGQRSLEHWYYPTELLGMPPREYQSIIDAYVRNGTAMDPTMIAWRARRWTYDSVRILTDTAIARGTAMGVLSAALIDHWRSDLNARATESPSGPLTDEQLVGWRRALDGLGRGIGQLHKAGVIVLAGTDLPLARLPGESLHDELALLVDEAGFTPAEAIEAATSVPARFFGMQDSLGTVAPNRIADLVLLDADPTEDIRNTRRIALVIVRGRRTRSLGARHHQALRTYSRE